jgi:hypothetical protein
MPVGRRGSKEHFRRPITPTAKGSRLEGRRLGRSGVLLSFVGARKVFLSFPYYEPDLLPKTGSDCDSGLTRLGPGMKDPGMRGKRFTAERIVGMLRETEVWLAPPPRLIRSAILASRVLVSIFDPSFPNTQLLLASDHGRKMLCLTPMRWQ